MHMLRHFLPVGQGAFYLERFWIPDQGRPINVVYDCGALIERSPARNIQCNQSNMERIIEQVFQQDETIHAVYLSHLHEDHVNGLQALCNRCRVNKVFFPLIAKNDLPLMRLQDQMQNNAGAISRQLIDFLENETPPEIDLRREQWIRVPPTEGIERPPERQNTVDTSFSSVIGHSPSSYGAFQDWEFVPYNFREQSRIGELKAALCRELQLSDEALESELNNGDLLSRWKDKESREKIKRAYKSISGEFNTNSMTLFSGRKSNNGFQIAQCGYPCSNPFHPCRTFHFHRYPTCLYSLRKKASGCLYTGDYNASGSDEWITLNEHYLQYWNSIGCIQIPHHGSRHSFNDGFCGFDAYLVVSAGRDNPYHHPHVGVLVKLCENGRFPAVVTQDPYSMFVTLVR